MSTPRKNRVTFSGQVAKNQAARASVFQPSSFDLIVEIDQEAGYFSTPFESKFQPQEMRQLALVAHNHMKPAMKEFIETYSEVLKKFRITGTNTTMRMCKTLWGEDNPEVQYGLSCTSGPLGGDAQVAALMCLEDLGGLIFFIDPLSAHPHQADIDSLVRLCNCGNVIMCINPTSAASMMHVFKCALEKGSRGMIPSFFHTLESPAVAEYKLAQEAALRSAIMSGEAAPGASDAEKKERLSKLMSVQEELDSDVEDADDIDYLMPVKGNRVSHLIVVAGAGEQKKEKKKALLSSLQKSMRNLGML
jgi:methylglyoxal synthase